MTQDEAQKAPDAAKSPSQASPTPPTRRNGPGKSEKRPTSDEPGSDSAPKRRSLDQLKLDGPAPEKLKRVLRVIRDSGVEFKRLPESLQDKTVAMSPNDKLGRVKMKRFSGVQQSPAVAILRKFKESVGSYSDLVEKLEASDKLGEAERKFIELVEKAPVRSLPRLVAEAGVRPSRLLKLYAEGAIALGKVQAAIEVSRNQPQIVKDLLRNALDQEGMCRVCLGSGKVKRKRNSQSEDAECPMCRGVGKRLVASKHKEYAMDKVIELGQLGEPKAKGGGGAIVNVSQQVAVSGGSGAFFSKVLKSTDEILYRQRFKEAVPAAEVVEAEAVVVEKAPSDVLPEDRS